MFKRKFKSPINSNEEITARYPALGLSWSQNWNINLLIAAATKMEQEVELEILVDDAGETGGISAPSAITIIGAVILCCFVLSCCLLLHLFVQEIRKIFEIRIDFQSNRNYSNRVSNIWTFCGIPSFF